jgi:hypothetical protein
MKNVKNSELDKYKGEPKDEIKVEIGDNTPVSLGGIAGLLGATTKEFEPKIKLSRWNEVDFSITPKGFDKVATKDKSLKFENEKIRLDTPKVSYEMYEAEDSYKYVWYLNEKPATNKVEFQIESEGLDFFYQPPMTEEHLEEGQTADETHIYDSEGNIVAERPENVVGSYAVYHQTKGGMNDINDKEYKTGKAFHIYRPHIIDASGAETWGNLHIENGIYSVEIPQEFLDTAVYPIKSNDTFGYTTAGATWISGTTDYLYGSTYTSPSAGTVTSMTVWYKNTNITTDGTLKLILVLRSNLTIVSNGITGVVTLVKNTLNATEASGTFSVSPTISATDYSLSLIWGNTNGPVYCDTTGSTKIFDSTNSYSSPSDPTDATTTDNSRKLSIYATYTPATAERRIIITQ